MDFNSFFSDIVSTVIGGILLALLFFFAKEKWFPFPGVTGRWYFEMVTEQTAYNPYRGMVLRYVAMLWREGNRVGGTVEKIYEDSSTGQRSFVGQNRTRGQVSGYVEKNYLGRDRLFLHVIENGHGRESTNFYELEVKGHGTMAGSFESMVADQNGSVRWQRKPF
jgi:hypothetical protein